MEWFQHKIESHYIPASWSRLENDSEHPEGNKNLKIFKKWKFLEQDLANSITKGGTVVRAVVVEVGFDVTVVVVIVVIVEVDTVVEKGSSFDPVKKRVDEAVGCDVEPVDGGRV